METEAPPTGAPPGPAAAASGEESEAKLRERLIERTRRLRGAVSDKTAASHPERDAAQQVLCVHVLFFVHLIMDTLNSGLGGWI